MTSSRLIHRRYQREFWPAMAAYVAIMFLLWPLLPRVHNELLKVGLVLLPVVPVLFVTRAMVRLVLGSDELEQRIHLIGLAVSVTVVGTLSLAGGFLAAAGVVKLDGAILTWIWPALVVVYSVGRSWASRRYGGGDVMCENDVAWHWRLLFIALVLAAIAWFGRNQLLDYQLGMLAGMAAGLVALGLMLAVQRWRRGRRAE